MKQTLPMQNHPRRTGVRRLIGLPFLAGLLFSVLPALAATPPDPAVELRFPEGLDGIGGQGITTTNTGDLSGLATFQDPSGLNTFPAFTTNVPSGPYAPGANLYSVDMGPQTNTGLFPGAAVALATAANPPGDGTLGAISPGLTVCGWLNARALNKSGDIAYAMESPGGYGFELGCVEYGALSLGINQNFIKNNSYASIFQIPTDPNLGDNNWVFFAATYDPTLGAHQLSYYIGKPDQLAYLDSAITYAGGISPTLDYTGPLYVGNLSPYEANYQGTSYDTCQLFPGLIDELKVYTNALTLAQVQQAQINGTVTPVAASILNQPANLTVFAGQIAAFTVRATGPGAVTYQWYTSVNSGTTWSPATGATNATFSLGAVTLANTGEQVRVGVSNTVGGVLSSPAILTVQSAAPIVMQLSFNEGSGRQTTNACAYFGLEQLNGAVPVFTNYVPSGPWAPNTNFNHYSLYNGASGGSRGVDLFTTNSLPPPTAPQNAGQPNWMGTFSAFTITMWVNINSPSTRTTANLGTALFHCSDPLNDLPNGIELTYKNGGSLAYSGQVSCGINDDNDWDQTAQMSTNSIMGDSSGLPYNWVFFAVTWDGSLSTSNMTYYFGSQTNAATPDATVTVYNRLGVVQTNIPNTGQGTVGGYSPIAGGSRTSTTGPTRGYIDEFHLFNRALTLTEIRQVQVGGTVPPVLGIASAAHNTTVEWGPTTTPQMQFQLQSRTNLISGAWANVTNTPLDSGNTRSVTLPATNAAKFFRLKNQ